MDEKVLKKLLDDIDKTVDKFKVKAATLTLNNPVDVDKNPPLSPGSSSTAKAVTSEPTPERPAILPDSSARSR